MPLRPPELHARAAARRGLRRLREAPPETPAAGPAPAARRLLVVKLADLGDALTATPALRALRDTWPDAIIDVLTTATGREALEGLASVDTIYVADKH